MDTGDLGVFLTLFLLLGGAALYLFGFQKDDRKKAKQNKTAEKETETVAIKKPTKQKVKKIDRTAELKKKKIAETPGFSFQNEHPSLLHLLHGHKYGVTAAAYSPNGKFLSTASTDRTLHIYLRETLNEPKPKFHQISIEYDHVTALNFSSDGKILVVAMHGGNVKLYHKLKVKPELFVEFPVSHKTDVHSILMNDIGNWATIVTCAEGADTELKFWNLRGDLLQVVNTNQVKNFHLVGSIDNRYISVAAYTPEVTIFEITREKTGVFKRVNKVMCLQGHRSGVLDLAFDGSDKTPVNHIVTVSKDATVRLWDINVRYIVHEDPKVLKSFTGKDKKPFQAGDISPNGKLFALAREKELVFISTIDTKEILVVQNALDDDIKRVSFDPSGTEVLVRGNNCKLIKIFKVPQV